VLWLHGDGFAGGDLDMPEAHILSAELAARTQALVVSVDYRPAVDGTHYAVPVTEHVEALGTPSWYARFIVQVTSDPALRADMVEAFVAASPSMEEPQDGLNGCLPDLPPEVQAERAAMTRPSPHHADDHRA
jgi:hypothetical protein